MDGLGESSFHIKMNIRYIKLAFRLFFESMVKQVHMEGNEPITSTQYLVSLCQLRHYILLLPTLSPGKSYDAISL